MSILQVGWDAVMLHDVGRTDLSQVDSCPIAELPSKVAKLVAAVAVRRGVHSWKGPVPCHDLRKLWPLSLQAGAREALAISADVVHAI